VKKISEKLCENKHGKKKQNRLFCPFRFFALDERSTNNNQQDEQYYDQNKCGTVAATVAFIISAAVSVSTTASASEHINFTSLLALVTLNICKSTGMCIGFFPIPISIKTDGRLMLLSFRFKD
jgi:hypothetical protein